MHIQLLLLGKTRRPEIRALIEDYVNRIGRFAEIEMRELREDSPAASRKLTVPAGATIVLLDAAGKDLTRRSSRAGWAGAAIAACAILCSCAAAPRAFPTPWQSAPPSDCLFHR